MSARPPLVEWQVEDKNGLVFPWWTHPFLDELKQWHLKSVVWLELGAGRSTAWLRSRCAWVDSIEANYRWAQDAIDECRENNLNNGRVMANNLADGVPEDFPHYLGMIPTDKTYDIISIDGIFRTEMVQWSIDYFKKSGNGGVVIMDNWQQDFVWISPRAEALMEPYILKRYVQPDHINHEGRPWNTTVTYIGNKKQQQHDTSMPGKQDDNPSPEPVQ